MRSTMAIGWLRNLMQECKRDGFQIRMSFEARSTEKNTAKTFETAKSILDLYPQIDQLELTTEETGGWEPPATRLLQGICKRIGHPENRTVRTDPAIARRRGMVRDKRSAECGFLLCRHLGNQRIRNLWKNEQDQAYKISPLSATRHYCYTDSICRYMRP